MLRTVLVLVLSATVSASAAGQVRSDPVKGSSSAASGSVTSGAGAVGGSTPGSSYSGGSANLKGSVAGTSAPQLNVIEPAPVTAARSAPNIQAIRPGGPGGCSRKTSSECGVEAATCLINNGLNGNHAVDSLSTTPSIRQTADRNEDQARAAGECANELRACLQPSC